MSERKWEPTWHKGMHGCPQDMFSRKAVEAIVAAERRRAFDEGAVAGMAREDGEMPDNPYHGGVA